MDPLTLAVRALIAVASGVTAGATGKLGESLLTAAQRWLDKVRPYSPKTVKRLEGVSDPNVIDVEILEEVKRVTETQPEVKAAMEEAIAAAKANGGSFPNLQKLAEKVRSVNFGSITNQNNNSGTIANQPNNSGTITNNF
ncbi:MAG: hypothetical protein WA949_05530 [Phormidesmis sp.]